MMTGLLSKLTSILAYHDNVSIVILGDQWSTGLGFDGPTKKPAHGRMFGMTREHPLGNTPQAQHPLTRLATRGSNLPAPQ
jgi:hypothetical protein